MDRVLTGDVLRGPEVVLPQPTKRRRRWPWIIGGIAGALALCLAVPVAVIAVPIIRETIEAGGGSNSPQEALLSYIITFEPPAKAQQLDAERFIVRSKRKTMLKQRADYIGAIEASNRAHPDQPARITVAYDDEHQTQVDIHGDRATVTEYWHAQWDLTPTHVGGPMGYVSRPLPWTATAQRQADGWRLTSLTIPPWCGTIRDDGTVTGYAKCP
jgi:hypothetical protein